MRSEFPIFSAPSEKELAFLDNAATTQKPECVIEAMNRFYRTHYSSVKRGVYRLSEKTTEMYEAARKDVARFLNAKSESEIVFTRGTTESINLVAWSFGRKFLQEGDEILVSALEHHANIVPWQLIAEERGASLRVIPMDDDGNLILSALPELINPKKTKVVGLTHVSNSVGTINPVKEIIQAVRALSPDTKVLVDAAQSAPHIRIDVQDLDCDFLALSGHKMYGPTGIGVLFGKLSLLNEMPPYLGGGEMIVQVTFEKTTYAPPPSRFEAGTPPIAEVIGLGEAVRWMQGIGLREIAAHESAITQYALEELSKIPTLRLVGNPKKHGSLISFNLDSVHPHDIAMLLDEDFIAVRSGHHCAQPVMDRLHITATARASFGVYTLPSEIDRLVQSLQRVTKLFQF
ncbi:MAG: cysteine desulfurase [Fibrobacter sp.]|nr:cysteine desulfurase [Fibrobacter sp.]